MNFVNSFRLELLNKDNYDTWRMQMEAVLIKNGLWRFVNGEVSCPKLTDPGSNAEAVRQWEENDQRARADIILSINPSELKQVKNCKTSREMWVKLDEIYQSKGPARKVTLLKRLILLKMRDGDDVREHVRQFFDIVDKLSGMEVEINEDLLWVILLYSLPFTSENFRFANTDEP